MNYKYIFNNALFLIWFFMGSCNVHNKPEKPNIILIVTDELQFEDLSIYGGSIPTPNIDKLAKDGMMFTNAYVASTMCTPSRFSILTGLYPGRCKNPEFKERNPKSEPYLAGYGTLLDSTQITLPKLLSENGYVSGMVGKWHLGSRGFMEGFLDANDNPKDSATNEKLKTYQNELRKKITADGGFDEAFSVAYEDMDKFPVKELRFHNFPWYTSGAIEFIKKNAKGSKPFFLYLAPTAIHGPNHSMDLEHDCSFTPSGKMTRLEQYQLNNNDIHHKTDTLPSYQKHRYIGMQQLDHQLKIIREKLNDLKRSSNTIIVFMPDHGTEPAKATCYNKAIKIPLIICWPENIKAGEINSNLVQSVDLLPTLLNVANCKTAYVNHIDGISFYNSLIHKNDTLKRNSIYAEAGYSRAIMHDNFKYITFRYPSSITQRLKNGELNYAPNYLNNKRNGQSIIASYFYPGYFYSDQLYDLEKDPYEQNNLAKNELYQAKLIEIRQLMQNQLNSFDYPFNLQDTQFMQSEKYKELVLESLKQKPADVRWYKNDWGEIIWPPKHKFHTKHAL